MNVRLSVLEGADFVRTQDGGLIPVTPEHPEKSTLNAAFLEALTAQMAEQVAAVRVNDERDFPVRKSLSGTTLTVEYDLSNLDNIGKVRQIALLDASGNVLTQTAVNIPLAEPTTIRHTLNLKEGTLNYGR